MEFLDAFQPGRESTATYSLAPSLYSTHKIIPIVLGKKKSKKLNSMAKGKFKHKLVTWLLSIPANVKIFLSQMSCENAKAKVFEKNYP